MTDHQRPTWNRSLSPDDLRHIDQACNRFEDACCQGTLPRIEDFLNEVVVDLRPALLQELLPLEMAYRQDQGKTLNIAEYQERFADYSEVVAQALMKIDSHTIDQMPQPNDESAADFSTPMQRRPTVDDTPPPRQIGNYEIIDKIAEGGMGIVFKARQLGLNRLVALKMIRPGVYDTKQALRRFKTEAEAVASLQCANIVQIYEIGTHKGNPFYSMEYVDGGALTDRLDGTPWAADMAAELIATLARAIQTAHDKRIVHRDLKPANVLIGSRGEGLGNREEKLNPVHGNQSESGVEATPTPYSLNPNPSIKITDFGLAKQLDATADGLTRTEMVMGTPSYMAPEQASGKAREVGPGADIYALGAILYELLTGRPPFKAATPLQTLAQVGEQEAVSPRRLNAAVPRDLETICLKCLQKEPARRYSSASALGEDLDRFLRHEPIAARPVGVFEKTRLWCRRNPRLAVMGSAIALLIVLVAVVSSVSAVLLQRRLDDLNEQVILTKTAERLAQEKRGEALFEKAHGMRISGQMGRRFEGLKALKEATEIAYSLNLPVRKLQSRILRYRSEAIACTAVPDFRVAKNWPTSVTKKGSFQWDFDPQLENYAKIEDDGKVTVWRVHDNNLRKHLPKVDGNATYLRFSPDSQLLAVTYTDSEKVGFRIWHIDSQQVVFQGPRQLDYQCDFDPNGRYFVATSRAGSIDVYDLDARMQVKHLQASGTLQMVRFSPDGTRLAAAGWNGVFEVWHWSSGQSLFRKSNYPTIWNLDWRADGKHIAMVCDEKVYIWDAESGDSIADFQAHEHTVTSIAYHPDGEFLVTYSWDGSTRLWHVDSKREVLRTNGRCGRFSRDGKYLSFGNALNYGLWQVDLAEECRFLYAHRKNKARAYSSACSPTSNLFVTCGSDGAHLWDISTGRHLHYCKIGSTTWAAFHPISGSLFLSCSSGLFEWPINAATSEKATVVSVGPPKRLIPETASTERVHISADSSTMAVGAGYGRVLLLHENKKPITVRKDDNMRYIALSPKGKWLAVGAQDAPKVVIYDGKTGEKATTLATPSATCVTFSPDGQWVVTSDSTEVRFWHVGGSWKKAHVYPSPGYGFPLFSPNGKVLAIAKFQAPGEANCVHLLDSTNCRLLMKLYSTPAPTQIEEKLSFSRDGKYLVAPAWREGYFCVWNLDRVYEQLAKMKLGRGLPVLSVRKNPSHRMPMTLKVDLGDFPVVLAEQNLKNKRWPDALAKAGEAIKKDPTLARAWYVRGRALLGLRKTKEGLIDLEHYLKLEKAKADDYDSLAWTYAHQRGHALETYRKAIDWANTAIRLGLLSGKANLYFQSKGLAQLRARLYEKSIASLQIAHAAFVLSEGKDDPWCCFAIAMAHARLDAKEKSVNHIQKAEQWFRKGDSVRKKHYTNNRNVDTFYREALDVVGGRMKYNAYQLYKKNNHNQAIQAFDDVMKFGYRHSDVYHYRGHAFEELKKYAKALADFEIAASKRSSYAHYHDEIALLRTLGPKDIRDADKALAAAQQALRFSPKSADYRVTLGIVNYRLMKTKEAIQILKKIPDKDFGRNRAPFKYLFLAMCYGKNRDDKAGEKALQRASSLYDNIKAPSVMLTDFYEQTYAEAAAIMDSNKSK